MKKMAIDLMLQWAYGGELLKNPSLLGEGVGAAIYGADGFAAITKFGKYGCFIDGGGEFPWMPDIEGPPHPDALRLDAAVQSLGNYSIEWAESKTYLMGPIAGITPDDYGVKHFASRINVAALIVTSARLRRSPDWGDDIPRAECMLAGQSGKVRVVPPKSSGDRLYQNGAHCPVEWKPDPRGIAVERMEYAAWRGALCDLVAALSGRLDDYHVLSPTVPELPWEGQKFAQSRILPTLPRFCESFTMRSVA